MPVTVQVEAIELQNSQGEKRVVNMMADQTTVRLVQELTEAAERQKQQIQDKGDEVLSSIPKDYKELNKDLDDVKESFFNTIEDLGLKVIEPEYDVVDWWPMSTISGWTIPMGIPANKDFRIKLDAIPSSTFTKYAVDFIGENDSVLKEVVFTDAEWHTITNLDQECDSVRIMLYRKSSARENYIFHYGPVPATETNGINIKAEIEQLNSDLDEVDSRLSESIADNHKLGYGVYLKPYGLGGFSGQGVYSDTNKYAYCMAVETGNNPIYIKSKQKFNFQSRQKNGTFIERVKNVNVYSIPRNSEILLEVYGANDDWGTTYTESLVSSVLGNLIFEKGTIDCIITPKVSAYVTTDGVTNIPAPGGNWATYKVRVKENDVLKIHVSHTESTYPFMYRFTNGSLDVIDNTKYTNVDVYWVSDKECDVYLQLCTWYDNRHIDPSVIYIESKYKEKTNMDGLNLCCIGDSYVANNGINPNYTWCQKIANKYGMNYTNLGISGGGLCATRSGITPVKDRYNEIPNETDIIILEGGENDANVSYDVETFKQEFANLVLQIKSFYANALLVIMCPWGNGYTSRNFIKPYADAMREVSNLYGIPFFDSWTNYVFSQSSAARILFYQNGTDSSHLNNTGHDMFLPKMEKFILSNI